MLISDISITRPVFASVISALLIIFGLVAYNQLPLREYPDINPPVVSVVTSYPGAAASIVETRITQIIEERIAGVAGIKDIQSTSKDGESKITIQFGINYDIDTLANSVRNRVSGILDILPKEADPPEIQKVDANEDVFMWMNLTGKGMTMPELTDYAERYLVDRFSALDGIARVMIGGAQSYAIRVWLNRKALAARNLTVNDVEKALRAANVELPAGRIESEERQFTVRVKRTFRNVDDLRQLVLSQGSDGYLIRLGEVARVEKTAKEDRAFFRGNGVPQVGIGIIKQSTANIIEVSRAVKKEATRISAGLPEDMRLVHAWDNSAFVEGTIEEVYKTLFIAIALVIFVVYLFLGSGRAMLVAAITVPVSVIATFLVFMALGFSINLLTLLALVLAIGLVVDDGIVVLENITRRMEVNNEPPLVAAYRGTREVGFAVITTTLVLVSVFLPIAFLQGDIGRMFSEFAITISAAVVFSSLMALTLSPMLASKLLKKNKNSTLIKFVDRNFKVLNRCYSRAIVACLKHPLIILILFISLIGGMIWTFNQLPSEYAPKEDRGSFWVFVNGPEGASYTYMKEYMNEIEQRLISYVESREITRLMIFGGNSNTGVAIVALNDWEHRRDAFTIINEIYEKLSNLPGVNAFPVMLQGFRSSTQQPVQFVIGGGTYEQLAKWKDILVENINKDNPGLLGVNWDYKETTPQVQVQVDYNRAAKLGVTVSEIGHSLETMFGSRRVTTYIDQGKEYDVILEGERSDKRTTSDLENIYVRSEHSGRLIPLSSLIQIEEFAGSSSLNRYNRTRALTLSANLADDLSLGEALAYLENSVRKNLPSHQVTIDYKGQSQDYKFSGENIIFIFVLGLLVTYLVLAAQFESYIHPLIIMLTVPMAITGGLLGLYFTNSSLNLYSQIGLIMLVGLAAKNGILIAEFANQLRDQGMGFSEAILKASQIRLRPILMTGFTTAAGALPLIMSSGAGSETRMVIGTVVLSGVLFATLFTLLIVPVAYSVLAKKTGSPKAVSQNLKEQELKYHRDSINTTK